MINRQANMPDKADTDEVMIPLFVEDTDGSPMKRKVISFRRCLM